MKPERFSLYVHWPFCEAKCPYCDFNSHVREKIDANTYKTALLTELEFFSKKTKAQTLTSIFFGGGTPSLMPPDIPEDIISKAKDLWEFAEDAEITLEANPGSSEAKKFDAFRKAGVNRLSLGVQSLQDEALKFLGRIHNADEAKAAIQMARDTFPRFSFDMIYARPGQTVAAWGAELEEALTLATTHLSLYQLTLEQDTAFYRAAERGKLVLPDEDVSADLFEMTGAMMESAGLPRYEISNYAQPGHESRHNLNYWQGGQYIGIGPGAHSRFVEGGAWRAAATIKAPEGWLKAVGEKGHGIGEEFALSQRERAEEIFMTGFRLKDGVSEETLQKATGLAMADVLSPDAVAALTNAGLLSGDHTRLALTPKGTLLLDSVVGEVLL